MTWILLKSKCPSLFGWLVVCFVCVFDCVVKMSCPPKCPFLFSDQNGFAWRGIVGQARCHTCVVVCTAKPSNTNRVQAYAGLNSGYLGRRPDSHACQGLGLNSYSKTYLWKNWAAASASLAGHVGKVRTSWTRRQAGRQAGMQAGRQARQRSGATQVGIGLATLDQRSPRS